MPAPVLSFFVPDFLRLLISLGTRTEPLPWPTPWRTIIPIFFFPTGILKKGISRETANADLLAKSPAVLCAPLHKDYYPEKFP